MEMLNDDFCEIIAPNWPHELKAKIQTFNPAWCQWAKEELSSGIGIDQNISTLNESTELFGYFLRVLNVAQSVHTHTTKGIPIYNGSKDIIKKAFEYCEIAEDRTAINLSNTLHYFATCNNYLEKVDDYFLRLSFKGKRILRTIPGFVEPPTIMESAAMESAARQQENIAKRLDLRSGQLRTIIEALDNDRLMGKIVNAAAKRKELGISQPLAKLRHSVQNNKIDQSDKDILLSLLK